MRDLDGEEDPVAGEFGRVMARFNASAAAIASSLRLLPFSSSFLWYFRIWRTRFFSWIKTKPERRSTGLKRHGTAHLALKKTERESTEHLNSLDTARPTKNTHGDTIFKKTTKFLICLFISIFL